jgi:hypothetical protein
MGRFERFHSVETKPEAQPQAQDPGTTDPHPPTPEPQSGQAPVETVVDVEESQLGLDWVQGYEGLNAGKAVDYIVRTLEEWQSDDHDLVLGWIKAHEEAGRSRRTVLRSIKTLQEENDGT